MLRRFLEFTGLVSPPPPPKRRPTARPVKPATRPHVGPAPRPEVTPTRPAVQPARPVDEPLPERGRSEPGLPTFARAVRTWIRQWGKHGTIPRAEAVALARRRLGADLTAYLTAVHLVDGQLTRYVLPESHIEEVAAKVGLAKRLDDACYGDLDTWSEAEKIDLKARRLAEYGGRPVPPALHIPQVVQDALIARMNAAAQALVKKGGGAGGKSGGQKPSPEVVQAAEVISELSAEPAKTRSRMPSEPHEDDEKPAEETATGKPLGDANGNPPPAPEDGEPEGGRMAPPRL